MHIKRDGHEREQADPRGPLEGGQSSNAWIVLMVLERRLNNSAALKRLASLCCLESNACIHDATNALLSSSQLSANAITTSGRCPWAVSCPWSPTIMMKTDLYTTHRAGRSGSVRAVQTIPRPRAEL